MKKAKFWKKGKLFYLLLGAMMIFINVPIVIVLILTQRTLTNTHAQFQSTLDQVLTVQMDYIQSSNPGRNHADQLSALREYALFKELGELQTLDYGEAVQTAEEILLDATTSSSEHGQITTYLHFTNSNYLIDSSQPGGNAIETANPLIFDALDGLDPTDTGVTRAYFHGGTTGSGEVCTMTTSAVFPDVIFMFYIQFSDYPVKGRDDYVLSEEFTASLKNVEICYYDSYGNGRTTSDAHDLAYQYDFYSLGPEESGYFSFRQNGHHYLCYYVFNDYNQSKFAVFFQDEIAEGLTMASNLLWFSGIFLIVACFICALLYVRRTYKPMDSLISRLDWHEEENDSKIRDDFLVLNEAISAFDNRLGQKDRLLSKFYLLRILRGQRAESLEDFQDDWLSAERGYAFAVAALHVDEAEGSDLYDESSFENAVSVLLKNEGWDIRTVTDNDFLFVVFRLSQGFQSTGLTQPFQRLQQELRGLYISVYISNVHQSARELRRCHSEAMAVSEYYIAHERIGIIVTHEMLPKPPITEGVATPDYSRLRKLSDCITTLSIDDAINVYDELVFGFAQTWGNALTADDIMFNMLVNTIALAFFDIDLPGDIAKTVIGQYVNQIRNAEGTDQLRKQMQEYLQALINQGEGQDLQWHRFEKIRDYVQENYTNPSLDSSLISAQFKTSPSTITRMFKKYNQTGFLDYVHQLRVLKAKELLISTNFSIAEISELVGYTNTVTMNRAFKTHAKTTPGMIRKNPYAHQ